MNKIIRAIALYLPQFHPIPENDRWWGKGFTEWTNVSKAKPRFCGHYQPHLPSDLGFYDLRVPEVREQQVAMAKEAGIYGFCYYHYWFNGKRLLERPVNEMLEIGKPDFPFMLCWANENWTRNWDGQNKEILIEQNYSEEDDRSHIRYLLNNVFNDHRYIKIYNKPVFCVYKTDNLPNIKKTLSIWREEGKKNGVELYLCRMELRSNETKEDSDGFDAAIEFQPFTSLFYKKSTISSIMLSICGKLQRKGIIPLIISYKKYVKRVIKNKLSFDYKKYPGINPGWDNSARRKKAYFAMRGSTPSLYGMWLLNIVKNFIPYSEQENFVFINSWNEWAEGNHLEPDQKWGSQYLTETKNVLGNTDLLHARDEAQGARSAGTEAYIEIC